MIVELVNTEQLVKEIKDGLHTLTWAFCRRNKENTIVSIVRGQYGPISPNVFRTLETWHKEE